MKKIFSTMILASMMASIFLFSGCNKAVEEDPEPVSNPTSVIFVSRNNYDVGEKVSFISQSQNASSYTWDFGDGTTSKTMSPTHGYATFGIYTVKLTTTNSTGGTAVSTTNISVGNRYIATITVTKIPAADAMGLPWDPDNSGPDITMTWREQGINSVKADFTQVQKDFQINGGTITYTLDPSKEESKIERTKYNFEFYDDDGAGAPTLMDKVQMDGSDKITSGKTPFTITKILKNSTSGGTSGTWELKIAYVLR